uniref:Wsv310-like protein n=1 Tax=Trachysalambria curvirostris nimavirus TaxID=2984282 RepID=A0A9C7F0S9_9VIRU|nr:MAG: wsv310-like protein [Trachysalambria curvirostris nimavirus]
MRQATTDMSDRPTVDGPRRRPNKRKRKMKKRYQREEVEQYRKAVIEYERKVAALDPTISDERVSDIVRQRMPSSLSTILESLGVSNIYNRLIPTDAITEVVTGIVVEGINKPIRSLIYSHILHYQELQALVDKRRAVPSSPPSGRISLIDELSSLPSPDKNEESFSKFSNRLLGVMTGIIERVAGVIERRELITGNNCSVRSIMSRIELGRAAKIAICKHLFNEISTFAGIHLYHFFIDDSVRIQRLVEKTIPE